jgi:hypothetical protein
LNQNYTQSIQTYIRLSAQKVNNEELIVISTAIENITIDIFDTLNELKVLNCKHLGDLFRGTLN